MWQRSSQRDFEDWKRLNMPLVVVRWRNNARNDTDNIKFLRDSSLTNQKQKIKWQTLNVSFKISKKKGIVA